MILFSKREKFILVLINQEMLIEQLNMWKLISTELTDVMTSRLINATGIFREIQKTSYSYCSYEIF